MAKWQRVRSHSYTEAQRKRSSLQGPLRVVRLCVLSILVPGLLLSIPLYMRNHVYIQQAYPVGMSDVRLLDRRISTTWCQRQVIWSNASYNAFLMSDQPELRPDTVKVSMTRHLVLEDDMKEYWGFYLLKGSVVTVSTCVRWPGASLIMIKGHRHLKECAYIGDDSSEELDEMFDGEESNNTSADYDISNKPVNMKKVRDGVVVDGGDGHVDISSVNHHHNHFQASAVEEALKNNWKIDNKKGTNVHLIYAEQEMNPKRTKEKDEYKTNPIVVNIPEEEVSDKRKTSKEIYDQMLSQLRQMGAKGKSILDRLNKNITEEEKSVLNGTEQTLVGSDDKSNVERNPLLRISANVTQYVSDSNKENVRTRRRKRRHIPTVGKAASQLTAHDEDANHAGEEVDFQPDGVADIHKKLNQTTDNDQSRSEFWSSFSSSEERLLECEGLLLNLPLTPNHVCEASRPESVLAHAARPNTVSYTVPSNGYYFFVFNSENEIQPNFIRTHFRLEKTTYNVSQAVASCRNNTGSCSLPLRFWSNDKVIIELPVSSNDSLWNEEFLAVTTCEPRTAVYVGCIVAMPLLIILFAFQ